MCGINGIICKNKKNDLNVRINKMNDSLSHRGPDAEGYKVFYDKYAFGHRRLSIIDIDNRSNQPMESFNGNILVYNGEIYNYAELKKDLDYLFVTNSDTEVILGSIEVKGIDWFLDKCNGMFAFAFFDKNTEALYIARDRMGIKPLYYYNDGKNFVFSSEIKGILNSGLVQAEFNESAIDEYLANRYVREPYTFFRNIYQIPAGSYIKVTSALETFEKKYWDFPQVFNIQKQYDEVLLKSQFEKELIKAISRRLQADVTVGTYLSGGVDSSFIAAVASKKSNERMHSYTIGFEELNEFSYARMVAERYDTNHHEIVMDASNYFEIMQEVIAYKDAPLGVPNEIPLAIMSKELKKNITVVLSGEGADELMGGYGKIFRSAFDYDNLNMKSKESFYEYFIGLYEYVPRNFRDKYLRSSKALRNRFDLEIKESFRKYSNEENIFRYFHKYHIKGLLQRVDTTTMLAGVEARVPFLDHELVEFVYENIPYDLKLKWKNADYIKDAADKKSDYYSEILDIPKYLLKKVAEKYLPNEVIYRKKMGFPVPLDLWIMQLEKNAKEILCDAEWLDTTQISGLIEECKNNQRSGQIIWMLINVEIFRKMYFTKEWLY